MNLIGIFQNMMVLKKKVSEVGFKTLIVKVDEVLDDIQEDLIELQNDRNCKDPFEACMNIKEF